MVVGVATPVTVAAPDAASTANRDAIAKRMVDSVGLVKNGRNVG